MIEVLYFLSGMLAGVVIAAVVWAIQDRGAVFCNDPDHDELNVTVPDYPPDDVLLD